MPSDLVGRGGRAGALDELLLGDTGPRRIGTYSEAACPEVGDVGQDGHEAHRDRASRRRASSSGSATSPVSQLSASPSSRCSSSSPPRWRATPTTCAPDSAKATAVARPNPPLAPVTTTVAPLRSTAVI